MRIVYCIGSLHNKGGMEKVLANKVNYFIEKFNYEIHIITEDQLGLPICYDFNSEVQFHDMAVSKLNDKVIKGYTFVRNVFKLRRLYNNLLEDLEPDVIIVCERGYLDFVIPFIDYSAPKVREYHFAREAVKVHASLMKPWPKKLQHFLRYKVLFRMFNKYDYLVLLTNRDKNNGGYSTKLEVIPNMTSSDMPEVSSDLKSKHVISVGSMHDQRKAFDVQIRLWKEIIKSYPAWVLDIYGDGIERDALQQLINDLQLNNNVKLHGNSNTMERHYLESSIFLFTSLAEGLPMVIIEALSYGIPCVSVDCPTGPSDIINNEKNGYLIEQGNLRELKAKLLRLMENEELRKKMGQNAKISAERYSAESVGKQWHSFFTNITK
tara:strand:+ start:2381 stop:3517 length:1137 start_codon:yes stop_codon:yes gene_type:complete